MFDIITNRIAVAQFVALAAAALVAFGIIPTGFDQAPIVALVLMVGAIVTAVLRFGHPGQPAADAKVWWQSRVIWAQIVAFIFALLAYLKLLPAGLDQAEILGTVMLLVAAISAKGGAGEVQRLSLRA